MDIYFSQQAKMFLNTAMDVSKVPYNERFIELTVIKPDTDQTDYILLDVIEEDWDRISVGDSHQEFTIEGLSCKALIRKTQLKYFNEINIDYASVEGNYVFTFVPKFAKLN